MEFKYYRREWLELLRVQEEKLRVSQMTASDCLRLGLIMERLAREVYGKGIAIRIITNGQITFAHQMEGATLNNIWWLDKKLNTCRISGVSSLRTLVEVAEGLMPMQSEYEMDNNYALCGGCFPLRTPEGRLLGYVECSALPHYRDHQLIADALAEFCGIEIPRIEE